MDQKIKEIKHKTKNWWKQNLANLITTTGLIFSFLFIITVFVEPKNIFKISVYAFFAGLTDFIDGPIARRLGIESVAGSYMDRIRDRLLIYPGIIILAYQYMDKIIFPKMLIGLLAPLILIEFELSYIGVVGLWWHIKGTDVDLSPNKWGKRKIFTGFIVVFIFIISFGFESIAIPCLKYSIWIIYLGLLLMIYWAYVSWRDYIEKAKNMKKAQ